MKSKNVTNEQEVATFRSFGDVLRRINKRLVMEGVIKEDGTPKLLRLDRRVYNKKAEPYEFTKTT